MEQEIAEKLHQFTISAEEKLDIALDEKDVARSKEECSRSLLGKIFGTKKPNFAGLRNTMTNIWQTKDPFSMREVGPSIFQFVFVSQEDKIKVLGGNSWSFDFQYLLLREWTEDILEKADSLNTVDLWVQVWNLPYHWICAETGRKIGHKFGKTRDILIPETGSSKGRHIKILAEINLEKPLLRGSNIKLGVESYWIDFKYENLQGFCMYCGVIGHADRGCITRKTDILNDKLNEGQFGDWLRASDNMASRQSTKFQRPNDEKEQRISVDKPMPTEEGGTESNFAQHENILGRKDGLGVEPLSLDLLIEKPDDVLLTQHKGQTKEPHDLQLANTDQYKTLEPVAKAECNKENVGGAANSSLTNVCVRLSKARVPLAEIQSPTTGNGVGKGIGGKGTRRSTKKGNIGISIREPMDITKEPADSVCGRKRPLTLLDEDEKICAGDLKKRKGDTYDEMEQDIRSEVEVASLKWAQIDQ